MARVGAALKFSQAQEVSARCRALRGSVRLHSQGALFWSASVSRSLDPRIRDWSEWRFSSCLLLAFVLDLDAPSVCQRIALSVCLSPRRTMVLLHYVHVPLFWELKHRNAFILDFHGFMDSLAVIALQ